MEHKLHAIDMKFQVLAKNGYPAQILAMLDGFRRRPTHLAAAEKVGTH
jgi:hypothetical protein